MMTFYDIFKEEKSLLRGERSFQNQSDVFEILCVLGHAFCYALKHLIFITLPFRTHTFFLYENIQQYFFYPLEYLTD